MDVKNISDRYEGLGGGAAVPRFAPNIRILLIDKNTTSLRSHASKLEQHLYKVFAAESTKVALSLLRAEKNYFNIVIADLGLPEAEIYVFVDKCRQMNIPLILMAEDGMVDIAMKALKHGPCYLVSKPLGQDNIATLWQQIFKVTGELPTPLTETTLVVKEEHDDPSSGGSCDGGASSQKQRKLVKTEKENTKRAENQIAEDSNSSFGIKGEDGSKSRKLCMTWTSSLHRKFLQAINILGEKRAKPETLLRMMNEPCLTLQQISAHLQEYRDQKARSVNLQKIGGPVVPSVQPAAPMSIFLRRQISDNANFNSEAARFAPKVPSFPSWLKPPNFVSNFAGYTLAYVKEMLDARNNERARVNNGFKAPSEELKGATRGGEDFK